MTRNLRGQFAPLKGVNFIGIYTGVNEMIRLSVAEGLREPEFDFDGSVAITLWRPIKEEQPENAQETHRKDTENAQSPESRILDLLKINTEISRAQVALRLNLTESQVIYHLRKMKDKGLIRREGSDKGGKWVVVD